MGHPLQIGFLSTLYHTSHLIRERQQVEHRLGRDCRWRLFGTGPEMMGAFGKGELDLGYIGLPPVLIGIAAGTEVVCIAGGHIEGTVMAGPPGYRSLEECGGFEPFLMQFDRAHIGIPARGSIHDVIFRELLARYPGRCIEIRNYSWADLIPYGISKGEVRAAVGTPPLAVLCGRETGARVLIPANALWPFSPSYGIVAARALLSEEGPFLEGFLGLHEESCNLVRRAPEEAARITVRSMPGLDERFVRETYRLSPGYCAALPEAYIRSSLDFLPVLMRLGYLGRSLDRTAIFDTRFVEKAHPEPPHYRDPANLRPAPVCH
ncbi:MAG: ABC transporter substrate-binding protein [bacterium]